MGEKARLEKVQQQLAIHAGPTQFPQNWQAPAFMLIFRIMRAGFTFKFLLIRQRINMDAGHNADDTTITKILVAQARFSGFLIVKTVLDHYPPERRRSNRSSSFCSHSPGSLKRRISSLL